MTESSHIPFFGVEVHSSAFMPHRLLFVDQVQEVLDNANFPGSHIYYLTRVPKVRFNVEKCRITPFTLHAELKVLPERVVSFDKKLSDIYPFAAYPDVPMDELRLELAAVDGDESLLRISVHRGGDIIDFDIPVENLLATDDIDLGFKPEVIYIGQSFDMLDRWQNHKQVNRALAVLGDSEELRLYFIHFSFFASLVAPGDLAFQALLDTQNRDSIEFRDRISVLEQVLIHFYRPALNYQHVGGTVSTAPFKRLVDRVGLKSMGLSLGMHGHAFSFWSPKQVLDEENVTLIDFNGAPQFQPGLRGIDTLLGS